MTSHLEVRSAYQAWCAANPLLPMDQFPDYSRLVEVADLEPVDTVLKFDRRYFYAASHIATCLRNLEPNDKILIDKIQTNCLARIEELQKSPNDPRSIRWFIPLSLLAANIYEKRYIYGGMLKHANDVRSALVKLDEMGIDVGPGTPYLAWRRSAVEICEKALEKMLLIGMRDQWIAEMEAAEGNSGPGSSDGYDGHDRDTGDDSEVDVMGSSATSDHTQSASVSPSTSPDS